MIYKINQTKYFQRKFRKLPDEIQHDFRELIPEFVTNPFASQFKTHKLHGELKECYASSINYSYRFSWVKEGDVIIGLILLLGCSFTSKVHKLDHLCAQV